MWLCFENIKLVCDVSDKVINKTIEVIERDYDYKDLNFEDTCELFDNVLYEYGSLILLEKTK